jgi:tetratricopeptide (TPR) repeat protein
MGDDFAAEVEDVFNEAAALEPARRDTVLDARCAGRPELRREVESLLASHDRLGTFLHVGTGVASRAPWPESQSQARVGQLVGHYRLVERIARGSMGVVYRAEDLALGRETAVKLLPPAVDFEVRRSVLAEAEASARLQHPAIATFYEAGEADGETFIAMEFVHGPTLRDRLRDGPLNVTDAVSLTRCLLEALAHAHAAGLLHRDIKPENIVVVGPAFAKLLDFGIAVPLTSLDAPRAGTIGYLAPEQLTGAPLDARTDVFQVGVVLYEMLTGRPLFGGDSRLQRLAAGMTAPDFTVLDAAAPRAIAAIVRRAAAHDPRARYDTAAAFLRALRATDAAHPAPMAAGVVAVADFENRTGSDELAWMASAVSDGIHNALTAVQGLSVTPRLRFAQALAPCGAPAIDPLTASLRLGCGWLVQGDVQGPSGGYLQITARIVEVATGRIHYSREEQGPLETLLALQGNQAAALASELSGSVVTVTGDSSHRAGVEAHEHYTRARLLIEGFGKGSLEDARELLERAIAIDPRHVEALAALTITYGLRAIASPSAADYEQASRYADRALAIDDRHLRSWVWKAYALSALGRHAEADACTRRALAVDPHDTEALYLAAGARLLWREPPAVGESLTLLRRAVERDETRGMWWLALGAAHGLLGHDREALYSYTRAERLEGTPTRFNTAGAAAYAGESLRRLLRLDEARTSAFRGLETAERSDHAYRDIFRAHALTVIGRVALDQGNPDAAEAACQQVLAQARGRPQPRAIGHFVVQALCGLARATGQGAWLDEAGRVFTNRETFNFTRFYGAVDADTLGDLARAAGALGREDEASRWQSQVAIDPCK